MPRFPDRAAFFFGALAGALLMIATSAGASPEEDRARLLDLARREQHQKVSENRKSQVGSGDRSEKIRTYNFPQNRVTDHRIKLTLHSLDEVLDGRIDEIVQALRLADQDELMQSAAITSAA